MSAGDPGSSQWNDRYSPWKFVHCGVCFLPFVNSRDPDAPPPVPFWLTECSHVVCNNHLNPDQTCRICGTDTRIELMPLQQDMPAPMSQWFQNIPSSLEDMVGATKFQYETMSNLIHFYKKKCMGLKELVEKLRREVEKLQMINGELLNENEMLHGGQISGEVHSDGVYDAHVNRKRKRTEDTSMSYVAKQSYSSPSGSNPSFSAFGKDARPPRITLRPGSSRVEQENSIELPFGVVQGSLPPQFGVSPQNLRNSKFAYQAPPTPNTSEPSPTNLRPINAFATPKASNRFTPVVPSSSFKPSRQLLQQIDNNVSYQSRTNAMHATSSVSRPATTLNTMTPKVSSRLQGVNNVSTPIVFNQSSKPQLPAAVINSRRFVAPSIARTPQIQPQTSIADTNQGHDSRSRQNSRIAGNHARGDSYVRMPPPTIPFQPPEGSRFHNN